MMFELFDAVEIAGGVISGLLSAKVFARMMRSKPMIPESPPRSIVRQITLSLKDKPRHWVYEVERQQDGTTYYANIQNKKLDIYITIEASGEVLGLCHPLPLDLTKAEKILIKETWEDSRAEIISAAINADLDDLTAPLV